MASVDERENIAQLTAQISALTTQVSKLTSSQSFNANQVAFCEVCSGPHSTLECLSGSSSMPSSGEQVNYVNNFQQGNQGPYSNTYNPGWRNHPNFSWRNENNTLKPPPGFPKQGPAQNGPPQQSQSRMEELMLSYMQKTDTMLQNQQATIRNLEGQISQISQQLSNRPSGSLPSKTEENPKRVNAIMLRSGKQLKMDDKKAQVHEEESKKEKEEQKGGEPKKKSPEVKPYVPPVPFPGRLKQQQLEAQFAQFVEVFKKLQINIPLLDALKQIPSYAKFLKELLSNKRTINNTEKVMLIGESSMVLEKKSAHLPKKLNDQGSFTVPCTIGNFHFKNVLIDSGASINLMPLSVFKKLGIGQHTCKKTPVTLQLADKSTRFSKGTVEDVLVKVDELIFPVDFTVLDMEEDEDIPLILGRPFLATGQALIDVGKGKLTLRGLDKQVTFDIHDPVPYADVGKECCDINAKGEFIDDYEEKDVGKTTLESVLNDMNDWDEEEDKLDVNGFEPPLQDNAVNYQLLEVHESKSEKAMILPPVSKPIVYNDNFSASHSMNSLDPFLNVNLNPLTSELKQELLGHLDEYREILGWTDADIYRVSSLISTYRTLVEAEGKCTPQSWDSNLKKMVMEELSKLLDAG